MSLRDDTEELAEGQRLEVDRRMFKTIADGDDLSTPEQQIVDRILELEDVEIDHEIGVFSPNVRNCARRHDAPDTRRRAELQLRPLAPRESIDRESEILDVAMNLIDLSKDGSGLGRGTKRPPRRMKSFVPRVSSVYFISRLRPGAATFSCLAAPASVPATITARMTSICRRVSTVPSPRLKPPIRRNSG